VRYEVTARSGRQGSSSGTSRRTHAADRLLREARAAASLNHPNICAVYEVGEAEGQIYIAMELVEGHPLSERLNERPRSVA
jgi:eukaryotic-like serine/threonine-protein kinase